jgi:DNA mismatch repair ATPase MutS
MILLLPIRRTGASNLQYIFYILIIILGLVLWSTANDRASKRNLIRRLKEEWGNTPEEEYTSEKFESLKAFYESIKDDRLDVDEITWNDLDMDEIYMQMNNTQCSIGEEYLYALLRKPCFSPEELEERNRLMKYFTEQEEERMLLQMKLNPIGKLSRLSVYEYINRLGEQETKSNLFHYAMAFGLILSVALIFINPGIGGILTVIFVANNILQYYKIKGKIDKYLTVFSYICRLLDGMKEIYKLDLPELKKYSERLKQDSDIFKRFRRGSVLLTPSNPNGNFADLIIDYIRMLFHIDLIKYNSMLSFFKNNREVLNRIYINVGFLDSMIAAASYRKLIYYYCEPELLKTGHPRLSVTDLYHPLLDEPIPNSITEDKSVLLTGSNASGKSTFIKTLAINAILSQTIYTSVSKSYRGSYFMIYSSMALRDSILSKESYYIVEIKSLKRILDRVNEEHPTLCFIDEVLRGTNTLERIAASSRILSSLSRKNALVFAATHDIELTHILENDYSNYHFQERIENNQVLFDYKLYKGKAISKNAIKLLNVMGYSKDIINSAENAAEEFLNKGEWSKIR